MRRLAGVVLMMALAWPMASHAVLAPGIKGVKLQGLNKVTAKVSQLEAPVGTIMRFGNLEIVARECWTAPPDKRPEHAALLEITENVPGEAPKRVSAGWMFASSPAISALEHAVYDITVLECQNAQAEAEAFMPSPDAPDAKSQ